jgi:hypothetical protein
MLTRFWRGLFAGPNSSPAGNEIIAGNSRRMFNKLLARDAAFYAAVQAIRSQGGTHFAYPMEGREFGRAAAGRRIPSHVRCQIDCGILLSILRV